MACDISVHLKPVTGSNITFAEISYTTIIQFFDKSIMCYRGAVDDLFRNC